MSNDLSRMRSELAARFRRDPGQSPLYGALVVLGRQHDLGTRLGVVQYPKGRDDLALLREAGQPFIADMLIGLGADRKPSQFIGPSPEKQADRWLLGALALITLLSSTYASRSKHSQDSSPRSPEVPRVPRGGTSGSALPADAPFAAVVLVLSAGSDDVEARAEKPDARTVAGWVRRATKWVVLAEEEVDGLLRKLAIADEAEHTGLLLVVVRTRLLLQNLASIPFQGTLAERLGEESAPFEVGVHSLRSTMGTAAVFSDGG